MLPSCFSSALGGRLVVLSRGCAVVYAFIRVGRRPTVIRLTKDNYYLKMKMYPRNEIHTR